MAETNFYVSHSGDNGNDGSLAHPFRTIPAAITAIGALAKPPSTAEADLSANINLINDAPYMLNAGDQGDIYVNMSVSGNVAYNNWVTIQSANPLSPATIQRDATSTGSYMLAIAENNCRVRYVNFVGASAADTVTCIYLNGASAKTGFIIDECDLSLVGSGIVYGANISVGRIQNNKISLNNLVNTTGIKHPSGCFIYGNSIKIPVASDKTGQKGILSGASNAVIIGNTIANFAHSASFPDIANNGQAIRELSVAPFIANNTMYNCTYGVLLSGATVITLGIYNNIYIGTGIAFGRTTTGNGTILLLDYNDAFGGTYSNLTPGSHSITSDPLFVDAVNGDFRLQPGSPCLNSGMPTLNSGYTTMGAWQGAIAKKAIANRERYNFSDMYKP